MGKIIDLKDKKCVACEGGVPSLAREAAAALLVQTPQWRMAEDGKTISRGFRFADFEEAMGFVSKVASLAQAEGHHPDIHISYNKVRFDLSTHAIGGLSENDFILAAKIDGLFGHEG
ncbi:MAG: 4a-hydroxytetrahydrobiopterin dehydratase [Candidatus Taylorbacteria bacterium]|nr:4a-hydroxytetrahydrobiopterin dehydratase [Candidatus Taylorbacteria bacterium]